MSAELPSKLKSSDPDSSSSFPPSSSASSSASLRTISAFSSNNMSRLSGASVVSGTRSKKMEAGRFSELTINKLKIQSIGLIGREKETDLLKARFQSMMQQIDETEKDDADNDDADSDGGSGGESSSHDGLTINVSQFSKTSSSSFSDRSGEITISSTDLQISKIQKELIFIRGFSGVGKTSLARAIRKEVNSTKNGFFAEGKFDFNDDSARDEPYSGIAKAFSELLQELSRSNSDMLLDIGQNLCELLGPEVEPLTYLVPELDGIVSQYSTTTYSEGGSSMEGMQERWRYSFRVFTRLLTAYVKPLVLAIDDLQWADKGSLDLLKDLICDSQNINPLMAIGLYRSNEVDESSELSRLMRSFQETKDKHGVVVHEIALESFGSKEVNHMIMKMMDSDDEDSTRYLAETCFQRTLGNPFFVIEFMSMLHREELIHFNLGTMKWVYDVSNIEDATMSTANVAELLQSRMKQMPADVQLLLSIAACLGPSLRVSILELVWRNLAYVESRGFWDAKVPELMTFIQHEMLVEPGAGDRFRWVHDKVQEAALTFVEMDKDVLRYQIGKVLYLNRIGKELEDDLFDIADLISGAKGEKSADFASLFLKAAKKARSIAAFSSASRYVQTGIQMLPDHYWETLQPLVLQLYTIGAQVELALGNVAETKKYCSSVLERKDVDMDSKMPFRVLDFRRLLYIEIDHPNAITAGLSILKDMGFSFRWHPSLVAVQAVTMLSKTIKLVKRQPEEFYLRLGRMDNKNRIIVEILNLLVETFMHAQSPMQLVLCSCHIVQLTLKHGLSEYSASHFGTLGVLAVLVFQMHKDAPLFREIALSTQRHYGRSMAANALFTTYTFTLAWTLRIDTLRDTFYNAFVTGMRNGEASVSMWLLIPHCIHMPLFTAKPIDQSLEVMTVAAMQMDELKQSMQRTMLNMFWQVFLFLQDTSKFEDPCVLRGEVHSIEDCGQNKQILAYHEVAEFQLLVFFDDPSAGDRAIASEGKFLKASSGVILVMIETFHRGISLYIAARRTKKRKYKKYANRVRTTLHKWKEQGNPNVVYYCMFLDAEQAALKGKHEEAETLYKKAIQFVAKSGILHHAGLFNERYSEFLIVERNDVDEAKYRLQEAIRYYEDWGAHGVVERVKKSSLLTSL